MKIKKENERLKAILVEIARLTGESDVHIYALQVLRKVHELAAATSPAFEKGEKT